MPIIPRKLHTKHELNSTQDKGVIDYHCDCHGNLVTIAMRYVADANHPKKSSYQIWPQ